MISITTVATYESTETAEPAEVLADFEQCIIDRAKIEWQKRLWACIKANSYWTLGSLNAAHCYDRNTVCLKDLTLLFIRQHKLWNDA